MQPAPSKRQLAALVMHTTTTATRSSSSSSSTRLAVACCARVRRARLLAIITIMRLAGGQPLHRGVLHLALPPLGNLALAPASLGTLRLMFG